MLPPVEERKARANVLRKEIAEAGFTSEQRDAIKKRADELDPPIYSYSKTFGHITYTVRTEKAQSLLYVLLCQMGQVLNEAYNNGVWDDDAGRADPTLHAKTS